MDEAREYTNGVENVWNKVESDLKELEKSEEWSKNRNELIQRLTQVLDGIPNSYFKKLYASYADRWRKCVKLGEDDRLLHSEAQLKLTKSLKPFRSGLGVFFLVFGDRLFLEFSTRFFEIFAYLAYFQGR